MKKARDIMSRDVVTVRKETSVRDLAEIFVTKRISSVPVVDDNDNIIGIVTETDLIEQDRNLHIPTVISLFDWVIYLESPKAFIDEVRKVSARKVGEICAREVITCTPDTPVGEIADLMVEHKIHLLPVLDGERLAGVVARFDLIRSMGR